MPGIIFNYQFSIPRRTRDCPELAEWAIYNEFFPLRGIPPKRDNETILKRMRNFVFVCNIGTLTDLLKIGI
jgi:hypothetical protein